MYENGEIFEVMTSFEKALKTAGVYVGGSLDRAEMTEFTKENGRTSKRFTHSYYNNGHVNALFVLFLHGYANGKCVGQLLAA